MGSGHSLPLSKTNSLANPGKESVVSDVIDCEYNAFLDEIMTNLKYPVPPHLEAVLKEVKLEEPGPDEFEVQVILDPAKLQTYGFQNKEKPDLARVHYHNKVKLDRTARYIETINYKAYWMGEALELQMNTRADFTKDPFQIDYFWTMPDGTRTADDMTLRALQPLVNQCMSSLADRKVVMTVDTSKKVFSCDPIDESITTYEPFFDALIATMRSPLGGATVEDVMENKFKIVSNIPDMPSSACTHDKEKGTVIMEFFSKKGEKVSSSYYSVSKSPLTVETYTEAGGERLLGKGQLRLAQGTIDATIYKATNTGWFGIF